MKIKMDVYPVEDVQARLEQLRAFILLINQEYMTGGKLTSLTDQDITIIELNMITLFDMIHDLHADLGKIIDQAYIEHKAAEAAEALKKGA